MTGRPAVPTTLVGTVERITYANAETGYTVLRLQVPDEREPLAVVGYFPTLSPGVTLRLTGFWTTHHTHGVQFKAVQHEIRQPATLAGIEKYLGSGLIKGIGPVTARRIVAHFREATLDILETDIQRLSEVPGIGAKRMAMIARAWEAQRAVKDVMLFLQSHGVSTHYAAKIYKQYGARAIQTVVENPYQLARDIYGIGFKTADAIAANLGVAPDAEARLRAACLHVLHEAVEHGHCFLPASKLVAEVQSLLGLPDASRVQATADVLAAEQELVAAALDAPPETCYHLPYLFYAEQHIARLAHGLCARPCADLEEKAARWLEHYMARERLQLSEEQRQAVLTAAVRRILVITGGPGCGKTTTLRAVVSLFRALGLRVDLAAPTGRAAQRLSEVTGGEARTLHRLLAYDPGRGRFTHDGDYPLDTDAVIVDEASMLDAPLAAALLKAVPAHGRLLLVGDVDQLPSVGPGRVLGDIIASGVIPVCRLTQVFRQAEGSLIIQNAHRIRAGQFPKLIQPDGKTTTDCYFVAAETPEDIHRRLANIVARSLPKRFGYDPVDDIQVLTPMNRGELGAGELNRRLQAVLNPPQAGRPEVERLGRIFRVGDKVVQRVNNYTREVFNGDIGRIVRIDLEEQSLTVDYGGREVDYDWADAAELAHAFALSVHKSQGSEYPAVVIVLHTQAFPVLSRNLVYTALTRAKQTAVLLGTTRAIGLALRRIEAEQRYTRLTAMLRDPVL
ncbi:MAG: ATP-dependent RecD-like DNA helicase [Chloracidobacterium sp.]|nr:ATP-dependent RecD-like DNA helicase [Chloracidobacterium sp.]MDW8218851.1 ATP-dependent RecD-like DNA helicase [Acidobacteriota bacterium]